MEYLGPQHPDTVACQENLNGLQLKEFVEFAQPNDFDDFSPDSSRRHVRIDDNVGHLDLQEGQIQGMSTHS